MILTKKQWVGFLLIFILYLLLGAFTFYAIESKEEAKKLHEEEKLKQEIDGLITEDYPSSKQYELFGKISQYCSKPVGSVQPELQTKLTWTFYHAVFFVLTVVSTIGYGNLSPTTPFTRVFMIVYGIIGIPINGIVIFTLGEYFANTFRRVYRRWRHKNEFQVYSALGLIAKVIVYLVPGFALLILIPSSIIVFYEDWPFDRAIEFAFGTLTTIGTGQFIPGTMQREHDDVLYVLYKAFLLIWIIIGLGYLAMFFNFLSQGLQSKKMFALEQKLRNNIKRTNRKIRTELRYLLNEYIFAQTYSKPVYRERRLNTIIKYQRTQSCPNLLQVCDVKAPIKKRAISELPPYLPKLNFRTKSDTDIENIDTIKLFEQNINNQHNALLIKVVNVLTNYNNLEEPSTTITCGEVNEGFESDDLDWLSEDAENVNLKSKTSTATINLHMFDSIKSDSLRKQESIEYSRYGKIRSRTLPPIQQPESLFGKFKRSIRRSITGDKPNIENQVYRHTVDIVQQKSLGQDDVHLNTDNSLSDFLRALSIINFNEIPKKNKEENNFSISTSRVRRRRLPIVPSLRRISLNSTTSSYDVKRRYSESCASTANCGKNNLSPLQCMTPRFANVMQKLKRSTSRNRSVVINIDP